MEWCVATELELSDQAKLQLQVYSSEEDIVFNNVERKAWRVERAYHVRALQVHQAIWTSLDQISLTVVVAEDSTVRYVDIRSKD